MAKLINGIINQNTSVQEEAINLPNRNEIWIIISLTPYFPQNMKHKHFTFDLDYFPITNSNVFQNIKI